MPLRDCHYYQTGLPETLVVVLQRNVGRALETSCANARATFPMVAQNTGGTRDHTVQSDGAVNLA